MIPYVTQYSKMLIDLRANYGYLKRYEDNGIIKELFITNCENSIFSISNSCLLLSKNFPIDESEFEENYEKALQALNLKKT